MCSLECMGRIPYATVLGFILVFVGAGVMCGTFYEAMARVDTFFRIKFFPFEEIVYFGVGGIVAAGAVIILSAIILVFAVLAAGATRKQIYRGDSCILGGRCSAGFFMALTYLAKITWLAISTSLVMPVTAWLIYTKICQEETAQWDRKHTQNPTAKFTYIFNLTYYGIYTKPYLYESKLNYRETIHNATDFKDFCNEVNYVGPLFASSLAGSLFVLMGLALMVGALASYYMRLKLTKELTEFKQTIDLMHNDNASPPSALQQPLSSSYKGEW